LREGVGPNSRFSVDAASELAVKVGFSAPRSNVDAVPLTRLTFPALTLTSNFDVT